MPYSWWTAWPRLTPRRPRNALAAGAATNVIGSDAANSCGSTLVPARRRCSIEGAVQTGCLRTFAAQTLQSPAWFAGKTGGKHQTHLAPRRHRLGQAAVRSRQLGSAPRKQMTMCCGCMGPAGPVSTECDKRGNEVACRSSRRRRPRTPRTLQVPARSHTWCASIAQQPAQLTPPLVKVVKSAGDGPHAATISTSSSRMTTSRRSTPFGRITAAGSKHYAHPSPTRHSDQGH